MFSVYSERKGQPFKHEVKALGILWSKFPEYYSAQNTVHIDDLSRNFAMNPKNGIKVAAYKDALSRDNVSTDVELLFCAKSVSYLSLCPHLRRKVMIDFSYSRLRNLGIYSNSWAFKMLLPSIIPSSENANCLYLQVLKILYS
jgi:ubiquitin-like domain-containing CTD phosphatase 1